MEDNKTNENMELEDKEVEIDDDNKTYTKEEVLALLHQKSFRA